ncbi:MAG: hypothetical protein JJ953_10055 [Gracilimonas sp.]|uniref:hypothetical protein n=1 Tax=Gracilimonas sp. TaxID=1974203 RepID=UPI001B0678E2|nr:hypothetical protein [Gracilimonas sp.]MBO6586436.1 hypothetical protein [Gracilimonas sp.]MBO6615093.1 hypothetical protein [Gracilimonas sp.]
MAGEQEKNGITTWFWVVGWGALLWNLLGVMSYIMTVTMSPEVMAELPAAQRELMANTPAWATGAFAFAVFGGALGSLSLLLKRKKALPLFIVSFIGIVVQLYHSLFMSNSIEVYGPGGAVMPIMVLLFGIGLIWIARNAISKGWLK